MEMSPPAQPPQENWGESWVPRWVAVTGCVLELALAAYLGASGHWALTAPLVMAAALLIMLIRRRDAAGAWGRKTAWARPPV